jgi:hypothetical protein
MALCPAGQKTTIEWQYAGETKQRIEGADDYSVKVSNVLTGQDRYKLVYQEAIVRNGQFQGWDTETRWIQVYVYNGIEDYCLYLSQYPSGFCEPDNEFLVTRSINPTFSLSLPRNLNFGIRIWSQGQRYDRPISIASGIRFVRMERENLFYQTTKCDFKATKNGVVVYQRTAPTCPTVTYFCGEKCPPGTCECTCGTKVCCYDPATGIAVKSFDK